MIRSLSKAEMTEMANKALQQETMADVVELVKNSLK